MKNIIAFDIDGVCVDICAHIAKVMFNQEGKNIWRPEPLYYDYFKSYPKLSRGNVMRTFHTVLSNPQDTPVFPGCAEFFSRLYARSGDTIQFITARNPKYASETHRLVESFCFVPFQIAFSHDRDKAEFMNGFRYFVDDRRRTCIELAQSGVHAFMPRTSYNRLDRKWYGITEIDGLPDLSNKIMHFVE